MKTTFKQNEINVGDKFYTYNEYQGECYYGEHEDERAELNLYECVAKFKNTFRARKPYSNWNYSFKYGGNIPGLMSKDEAVEKFIKYHEEKKNWHDDQIKWAREKFDV